MSRSEQKGKCLLAVVGSKGVGKWGFGGTFQMIQVAFDLDNERMAFDGLIY